MPNLPFFILDVFATTKYTGNQLAVCLDDMGNLTDLQMQQAMVIAEWRKATPKMPYSVENTGFNFQTIKAIPAYVASTPTSCQMKRPA